MKIGIYGGAFCPVHNEHIRLARTAMKQLGLDKLIVIPTYKSPHKSECEVSYEHRLEMARQAFKFKGVEVSDIERHLGGISYTWKTVEYFSKDAQNELYLIIGGDSLSSFSRWVKPQFIADRVVVCCGSRSGSAFERARENAEKQFGARVVRLKFRGKQLSSTFLRYLIKLDCDTSGYLPQCVRSYIDANGLFAPDSVERFVIGSEKEVRRVHTAGVVECGIAFAEQLGVDKKKAVKACIMHDLAKYLCSGDYPDYHREPYVTPPVEHAFLGEYIARTVLGETDSEVLDAVKYHSTGRPNMTALEKVVFVADLVERGRNYPSAKRLRKACYADFDKGFLMCLKDEAKHLRKNCKKEEFCELTQKMFIYYMKEGM